MTMKLRCVELFIVLTSILVLRPASSVPTSLSRRSSSTGADIDEDPSVNEVDKKSKPTTDKSDHDAAELDNRIPVIFSDLSDIERALSSDGSVTGSGELKTTNEHAQSTTISGETNTRTAPKYMLDLYEKFSKDKYSHPMANIVRSFTNMNRGIVVNPGLPMPMQSVHVAVNLVYHINFTRNDFSLPHFDSFCASAVSLVICI